MSTDRLDPMDDALAGAFARRAEDLVGDRMDPAGLLDGVRHDVRTRRVRRRAAAGLTAAAAAAAVAFALLPGGAVGAERTPPATKGTTQQVSRTDGTSTPDAVPAPTLPLVSAPPGPVVDPVTLPTYSGPFPGPHTSFSEWTDHPGPEGVFDVNGTHDVPRMPVTPLFTTPRGTYVGLSGGESASLYRLPPSGDPVDLGVNFMGHLALSPAKDEYLVTSGKDLQMNGPLRASIRSVADDHEVRSFTLDAACTSAPLVWARSGLYCFPTTPDGAGATRFDRAYRIDPRTGASTTFTFPAGTLLAGQPGLDTVFVATPAVSRPQLTVHEVSLTDGKVVGEPMELQGTGIGVTTDGKYLATGALVLRVSDRSLVGPLPLNGAFVRVVGDQVLLDTGNDHGVGRPRLVACAAADPTRCTKWISDDWGLPALTEDVAGLGVQR